MLSLSTSLISNLSNLSFEERVKRTLDGGIPGLVLDQELPREEIPGWVQESRGAGHSITAIEAPWASSKSSESSKAVAIPCLFAVDENERRAAVEASLETLISAEKYEIETVFLSARNSPRGHKHRDHETVLEESLKKRERGKLDRNDPEVIQWLKKLQEQQRSQLANLTRKNAAHPDLQRKRSDALLRSLDAILQQADRQQLTIGLRETAELDGFPQRDSLDPLVEEFAGAPLRFLVDPAAATTLSLLHGRESVNPFPDLQLLGVILRDCKGTSNDQLIGEGELDIEFHLAHLAPDLLRIVEAPAGTLPPEIRKLAQFCHHRGIDGNPPPQPGDPFPIIGSS